MKARKLLLILPLPFVALFLFLDSDFYETRRIRNQIENDLQLSFTSLPELIARETYGWAEEGGDKELIKLSGTDCKLAMKVMLQPEDDHQMRENVNLDPEKERETLRAEYIELFRKYNFDPHTVKTWYQRNSHGDFVYYILDIETCVLYRQAHFE